MKLSKKTDKPFGQVLLERGLITSEQLSAALDTQRNEGGMLGEILMDKGFISEIDIANALSLIYGFPFLPLDGYMIDETLTEIVPKRLSEYYLVVPIDRIGNTITIAMVNPLSVDALEDIEYITKCETQIFISTRKEIIEAIARIYGNKNKQGK